MIDDNNVGLFRINFDFDFVYFTLPQQGRRVVLSDVYKIGVNKVSACRMAEIFGLFVTFVGLILVCISWCVNPKYIGPFGQVFFCQMYLLFCLIKPHNTHIKKLIKPVHQALTSHRLERHRHLQYGFVC